MGDLTDSLTPSSANSRQVPIREDCWSEDATSTLIDAWGRRFLELNRGNLRQKDWQDVADSVNSLHGLTKKTHRTDVQCKNRIDTVKKKYKTERARVSASHGNFVSSWPFYSRLDELIGPTVSMKKPSSPPMALPLPFRKTPPPSAAATPAIVAVSHKRTAAAMDDGYFRRNYSAMAAAAAAAALTEEEEEDEEEEEERVSDDEEAEGEGISRLARAIKRFGEVYERVEAEKVRQMVELEKQRMQFAKDLEVQRMHMFMETQVQLERIKRGKKSTPSDI
ncbi:unnamed protein product [Citrullus colocynthis]|uniref:Myb/SANT-like DNA-binding domain-containing protein n=1 Tax=Citrullus colocynthis TaxID=252529 RepID=A0ABP0Z4R1_9ROSI